MAALRAAWKRAEFGLEPEKLVFLDETWTKTNMTRPRGRAPRGERLVAHVPHGHWKTTTFLGALRVDGLTAPLVVDGAINGRIFLAYVEQELVPTLRRGEVVIMDNLSSHKVPGVRQALEAVGASVIYLPPYSPDLNPIENLFSKVKSVLRKASERTVEGLWRRLGKVVESISPRECRNYFRHCGYCTPT